MHIEILVEDSSGRKLLEILLPKVLGDNGSVHTWRLHSYKGVGRIPGKLSSKNDPSKRILLENLPRILRGYGRASGVDAVVVVLDSDKRNCKVFLKELQKMRAACGRIPTTLFRLAIEEMEAWYLGDREALLKAYPRVRNDVLTRYTQDSLCDTWELLADAIHPGGVKAIKDNGWPLPGQLKHEWAEQIGPWLDIDRNVSPSFKKLRDGLLRLVDEAAQ
jgi:hypothetical protein